MKFIIQQQKKMVVSLQIHETLTNYDSTKHLVALTHLCISSLPKPHEQTHSQLVLVHHHACL